MSPFELWVANAVVRVSGIWPRAIACESEKRPLTSKKTRTAACQEVLENYFQGNNQVSARLICEVPTNQTWLH